MMEELKFYGRTFDITCQDGNMLADALQVQLETEANLVLHALSLVQPLLITGYLCGFFSDYKLTWTCADRNQIDMIHKVMSGYQFDLNADLSAVKRLVRIGRRYLIPMHNDKAD